MSYLKIDEGLHNIPVVMLSNLNEDQKIKEAFTLYALDYMVKTQHSVNEMIEKVNEILN